METTIMSVKEVDFGKVKKRVVKGMIYCVRHIKIKSKNESLTVLMFADSPDQLVQKRGGKDEKNG